jgi:predicted alpha/beta hydrolase family esterase
MTTTRTPSIDDPRDSTESPAAAVLVVQGAGRGAHEEDRAIADELQRALGPGFRIVFPRLPGEDDPQPDEWKRAIATEAASSRAAIIVAHSAGAAVVADLLAEGRADLDLPGVRAAFLLAPPYMGRGGWALSGFHFDAHRQQPTTLSLATFFYFGDADEVVPADHAACFKQVFPGATFRHIGECGHQFAGRLSPVAQDIEAAARSVGLGLVR